MSRIDIQRQAGAKVPVDRYLDPQRLQRELAALRRWPQVACAAADLHEPGDWVATELLGIRILLVRGGDGRLRAFLNACRHRGVAVADGRGQGRARFVCPYHSWTYDCEGALVGRPQEADFAHAPREVYGLVEIPIASRCGLVWVVPSPGAFDWRSYFGSMARTLEGLGYDNDSVSPHRRACMQQANWKLLVEGALETYHFQYAHRQTIAPFFKDDSVQHESFGRNQRILLPRRSLEQAASGIDRPSAEQLGRHASLLSFFFPSSFLLWNGDHVTVFVMRPHTVDTAETDSFLLVPRELHREASPAHWERNFQRLWNPLAEDYALSASIQQGLRSGANAELVFGANEFAGPLFHSALDECLGQSA